jgi:hypothetical protein
LASAPSVWGNISVTALECTSCQTNTTKLPAVCCQLVESLFHIPHSCDPL